MVLTTIRVGLTVRPAEGLSAAVTTELQSTSNTRNTPRMRNRERFGTVQDFRITVSLYSFPVRAKIIKIVNLSGEIFEIVDPCPRHGVMTYHSREGSPRGKIG